MGGCTSKRAAAVKAQQQSNGKSSAKPSKKKKKKGKAKIYSAFASMESLSNEIPVSLSIFNLFFIHIEPKAKFSDQVAFILF